ncbi:MAG: T9SS C-terminal target domain-containing protein [Calditrichaeota bacterium]|nr:MAG: T9SS C-terminal target domain-containing protein [Calditrichota bacterium]
MKNFMLWCLLSAFVPLTIHAQVYLDPDFTIPATVYAYKTPTIPVIDGNDSDWQDIPWTQAFYNDRDFNGDGLPDPLPDERDFVGRFKAAWMDGSSVLYLLLEFIDDEFVFDESISWYQTDGVEIRIDPLNEDKAGEPGSGSAFNLGFRFDEDTRSGIEGPEPEYSAAWGLDESSFPFNATLEIAVTLPEILIKDYEMGFHLFFNDTDTRDEDPSSKVAALQLWPQLWDVLLATKLGVDATWANTHSWGGLVCLDAPVIHNVSGGGAGVIQQAVDAAKPGDIIAVGPGLYTENIDIYKPNIRIIGSRTATDSAVVVPVDPTKAAINIQWGETAVDVIIDGLVVDGKAQDGSTASTGIFIGSSSARILNNVVRNFVQPVVIGAAEPELKVLNTVVQGNTIYHASDSGIRSGEGAHPNTVIRYNTIYGLTGGYGIDQKGLAANSFIDLGYNTISDVRQCGIGWGGEGVFAIHHNVIYRSLAEQLSPTSEMDDGIENQESTASTSYIYNNTISGWDSDGAQLNGPSSYSLRNNIVTSNDGKDYDLRSTPVVDIDYSLSYENVGGDIVMEYGTHSKIADPAFESEDDENYSLTATSPAIDAGEAEPFGFKVFYVGASADAGAIEYGAPVVRVKHNTILHSPSAFGLKQNYPNPFNPSTTISFNVAKSGNISLKVYDVTGRHIATPAQGIYQAGRHEVVWNADGFASGVYLYTMSSNGITESRKMLLVR